ncbi:MFS transporter [Aneurinibacillus terranovensis]|uniref:MFS transporter n=1 Tax=Aneurinibacillus terranovensis TaxID=278991 RepID=UPI000426BC8B|nr:MFS transporter [Aneurinibacillus terranovensis]
MSTYLSTKDTASISTANESEAVSKGQLIYASIVAFFAWTFSVYDFILFGTLLPVMAADFHWTTGESAKVATWVSIGTFLVSLLVGPITDYFGRKNALLITTAGAAISSGLTGFTMNPLYLILVRAISGLGYSEQAVNTTYLSEISGHSKRGLLYSFIQGGWPIGVLFASFMTAVLLPHIGWRGVFWVGTLPAVIILLLRIKLKESPKYQQLQEVRHLMKSGKTKEAHRLGQELGIDSEKMTKSTVAQLFAPDIRRHTIFLGIAFTLNWFAIQIFAVLSTTVLTGGKGISFNNSLFLLILSNALSYVGYVFHGYLGDKFGRRGTIIVAWICGGLSYTYMLFIAHGYWPVLISYSIGLFFLIGSYSALFTYMGESFPTRIRGTGSSLINSFGTIGGILGSVLFTVLVASGTPAHVVQASFFAGALPLLISGILMFGARSVPPSQSLEEISK